MKTLLNIVKIFVLIFFLFSCEDVLDLHPKNSISEATFWKTEKDLNAAVNATYKTLQNNVRTFAEFGMFDVMTEVAASRTVAAWNAISVGVFDYNHNLFRFWWRDCYEGIVKANDVIEHIDQMDIDINLKNERKGEVLFLRAFYYYILVNLYGDVPLILEVPTLENALVSRDSQTEVVNQIHKDLDEAIDLLPNVSSDIGRATKGAALTLKAKAFMQGMECENAIPVLEEVMELGYSLYDNYRTLFLKEGENNSEVIFDVQYVSQTGMGQGNHFNGVYSNQSGKFSGWSWLLGTKELIEMYETKPDGLPDENPLFDKKDPRMDMTVMRPGAPFKDKNDNVWIYPQNMVNYAHAQTGMHLRKFVIEGSSPDDAFSGTWDAPQNWIFFRYADVLLLYAEAVNEVHGGNSSVYNAINTVRARPSVEMPPIQEGKSQSELREIIRRERGVELAMEGWRYFDLKRWGLLKDVNDGFKVVNINNGNVIVTRRFEDHYTLWPIPKEEMDNNPNLIQNPGY